MLTEFADVSRTLPAQLGDRRTPRASAAGSRRSCRPPRTRARCRRSPLNIVNCASCVGLTRPSGYRTTTRVCGTPWKACATALPVSPEVATRTVSGSSPRCERRHQPRHHARADVLERERRPVKQLEREDARLDFDQRNRKIQRLDDDRLERRRVELAARERPERAQADLGQRAARQPRELVRASTARSSPARRGRRRAPARRTAPS